MPKTWREAETHLHRPTAAATVSYWQHCENLSGTLVDPGKWQKSLSQSETLELQTNAIADKLALVGVECRRPLGLSAVGVCSGKSESVTAWRHINFLPIVAASNRSQLVKRLSYFAESRRFLRYIVVTNGKRCRARALCARARDLARSVSRFAAHPALKDFGVSVELRVTEVTAERGEDAAWSYHPHCNVVINCRRRIDWQSFLKFATKNLPGHWKDCGRLIDANEAVKYFVKPAEVLAHSSNELLELFNATKGLHLATPMGALKDFGAELKLKKVKLSKKLSADRQSWKWCFVNLQTEKKSESKGERQNIIVAKMCPQPRFVNRFEPCLLVKNYSGDRTGLLSQNKLCELYRPSLLAWQSQIQADSIRFTPSPQLTEGFRDESVTKTTNRPREYRIEVRK